MAIRRTNPRGRTRRRTGLRWIRRHSVHAFLCQRTRFKPQGIRDVAPGAFQAIQLGTQSRPGHAGAQAGRKRQSSSYPQVCPRWQTRASEARCIRGVCWRPSVHRRGTVVVVSTDRMLTNLHRNRAPSAWLSCTETVHHRAAQPARVGVQHKHPSPCTIPVQQNLHRSSAPMDNLTTGLPIPSCTCVHDGSQNPYRNLRYGVTQIGDIAVTQRPRARKKEAP
jgi:hypothetical protein